jgi:hypothetical protein
MESADGEFDYSTLSLAGLEHALNNLDPLSRPKDFANARAAIAARRSGMSAEPRPIDPKPEALFVLWVERIIGGLVILYCTVALMNDDLVLMVASSRNIRFIHLHGRAAWYAAAGLVLVAGVLIVGGFDTSDPPRIRPKFRLVLRCALVAILVGVALSTRP